MDKNYKFIFTDKEEIRDELLKLGFHQINDSSGNFLFINDASVCFSENILSKVSFTNKICF